MLYLTEADVEWLLDMPTAIECVETAFREWAAGRAENQPRRRVATPDGILHVMSASAEYLGFHAAKIYSTTREAARFHVLLYRAGTGELVAMIEANRLGQMRTGAVSGVATRVMARPDAAIVGCFGTGLQARTQLQAVCAVRKIERIEVYGRHEDRRKQFAAEMTELCNVPVVPVATPDDVAAEKDIVITATTSKVPVFEGRVLDEGTHLNVIGSNWLTRAEVDMDTLRRADRIVCDSEEACRLEAGDFVPAIEAGVLEWDRVHELSAVLADEETGRALPEDITLFKSVGLALCDLAVAVHIVRRARDEQLGTEFPA
jgi:alanine dehydrogenase